MNIHTWQRVLSYFRPILIEEAASEQHHQLELYLHNGEYQLSSEKAIYSWGLNYYNFDQLFAKLILPEGYTSVLVLGMGLGSVIRILEKAYNCRDYHYTSIEHDEQIALWAEEYVLRDLSSPNDVIIGDAMTYVETCADDSYDMIIIDIFDEDMVPEEFLSYAFIYHVRRLLRRNGLAIQNLMHDNVSNPHYNRYSNTVRELFPQRKELRVRNCHLMVSQSSFLK